jgi:hypothetical protein
MLAKSDGRREMASALFPHGTYLIDVSARHAARARI